MVEVPIDDSYALNGVASQCVSSSNSHLQKKLSESEVLGWKICVVPENESRQSHQGGKQKRRMRESKRKTV